MRKLNMTELARPDGSFYEQLPKLPVTVVLDDVRSLNNVGSFFRTSDAFLIEKIILCGITGTPPERDIHKTALGAETTVRWEYRKDIGGLLDELLREEKLLVAVEQTDSSVKLQDFTCNPDRQYVLIFGNEVAGVSEAALERCQSAIEIPQGGTKHSLNVSVAAGVVLWHFFSNLYLNKV